MRGTSKSPGQMTMIAYSRVVWRERFFAHVTVRSAIKFFKLSRVNSMGTLADKINFTLYAKTLSSSANHATQSLSRRNRYMHNEVSYKQYT